MAGFRIAVARFFTKPFSILQVGFFLAVCVFAAVLFYASGFYVAMPYLFLFVGAPFGGQFLAGTLRPSSKLSESGFHSPKSRILWRVIFPKLSQGGSSGSADYESAPGARRGRQSLKIQRSKRPSVDVVLPFRLPAQYLERAVRSALASEQVDLTLILVKDGDGGNMATPVRNLIETDPRIKFIDLENNSGPYFARNLGVLRGQSEYIAFLDSDDEQHPARIIKQIEALNSDPRLLLTQCFGRRWEENLSDPLTDLRPVYISLVFRRSLLQEIGFFDSVRFSGDAEYISRVRRLAGPESTGLVKEELYFLRSLEGSLTRSEVSRVFERDRDRLRLNPVPARVEYEQNFKSWHRAESFPLNPRVEFPQRFRSFELGSPSQEASPFIGEKVIGSMASFPSREYQLEKAVASIYPQVDFLYVYLNGYTKAPAFLRKKNVSVLLQPEGDLKDVGKFFGTQKEEGYIFLLDDDLQYPENYVQEMLLEIEAHLRRSVVGVHGISYSRSSPSLIDNRKLCHFLDPCSGGRVDALGTGTMAYHSDTISFGLDDFETLGFTDICAAKKANELGVEMRSIPRAKGWLKSLPTEHDSRLYQINKAQRDQSELVFKRLLGDLLLKPVNWHED